MNLLKRTAIAAALALSAGVAYANQIVVDVPPDISPGRAISYRAFPNGPLGDLLTEFSFSEIQANVQEIPGFRLTLLQLYLGGELIDGDGNILGGWRAHVNDVVSVAAPLADDNDPLQLVTVSPPALLPILRIASDVPETDGLRGKILYGRVLDVPGGGEEVGCVEVPGIPRDCQIRNGNFALAFRATYNSIPEPSSVALTFAGIAAVAWTFRRKRKTGWGPTE